MTVDFILTGNFSSSTEGFSESTNISTATNNIESVSYSDTLTINANRWILDLSSQITVSGLEQQPTILLAEATYTLPLTQEFDFTISIDSTLIGQDNRQYLRIYSDEITKYFDFGIEADSLGVNYSEYTSNLIEVNTFTLPVGSLDLRVIKHGAEIYLYIDSTGWQIVTSDRFDWLLESELKMKLITEKVSVINPQCYWSNLDFQNNIEYSTPAIWRSKAVGDHLTLPPLLPTEYDLISWSKLTVDNVPLHGKLYCQCSTAVTDPVAYIPDIYFPVYSGPLVEFNPIGLVWEADISSLNLVSKFLTVRLILSYSAVPYQDFIQYSQYVFNLVSIPQLDVTLDYVPLNSEIIVTEQGLVQSSIVDWERLDSRTIRIKSLVSNNIEPNTHLQILYQIPAV